MTMLIRRDVRRVLGPLDPAARDPLVSAADRDADLRFIITTEAPHRPVRRYRRRLVAAAAATAVLAAGAVVLQVAPLPEPAYAATPAALAYAGGGDSAAATLVAVARRAEAAPRPMGTGDHEHLVTLSWDLWTRVNDERVRSAVIPTRSESWRGPDNSGRVLISHEEPQFPAGTDRLSWWLHGRPGDDLKERRDDYAAGTFPAMWADQPPVDGFRAWLSIGHPVANGPAETLVAATDLARERLLTPTVRADVLRVLAGLPGLTADGPVTDRAGRQGLGFSLLSDYGGLPTRYTLIVDPTDGDLLGFEKMLTTTAGKLDVRVPAVIGYETYQTAEWSGAPR